MLTLASAAKGAWRGPCASTARDERLCRLEALVRILFLHDERHKYLHLRPITFPCNALTLGRPLLTLRDRVESVLQYIQHWGNQTPNAVPEHCKRDIDYKVAEVVRVASQRPNSRVEKGPLGSMLTLEAALLIVGTEVKCRSKEVERQTVRPPCGIG